MSKIGIVLGTAREGNNSERVFKFIKNYLDGKKDFSEFNVSDALFGKTTKDNKDWADFVAQNNSIIFVTPEYNHSYPGELKILIDSLYEEYSGKKAGVASVSAGPFGGVRVVEELNRLLHVVNFSLSHNPFNISNVTKVLSEDGVPVDDETRESLERRLSKLIDELSK